MNELHKKIGHTDRDARYPQITKLSFPAQGQEGGLVSWDILIYREERPSERRGLVSLESDSLKYLIVWKEGERAAGCTAFCSSTWRSTSSRPSGRSRGRKSGDT